MKFWVFLTIFVSTATHAQLEEIVVTAQAQGGYYNMPAVTLKKEADFLVQNIRLVNDSRSPERRKSEIFESIEKLIKRSQKMTGIALSYGDGFLTPVNLNDDSLQIINDKKRIDTSYVDIFVKVALNENASPKAQISSMRKFITSASLMGRTEILPLGDIGLSIIGPEQYRYAILKKIAAENKGMVEALGERCKFSLSGLQNRVEWERSGLAELTLYIGYESEITCH